MEKLLVRVLAFCRKELASSIRQPLKILGLVLGPFIIMAIFASGYVGKTGFATALVVPAQNSTNLNDYKSFSKDTFDIVQVTHNKEAALAQLNNDELGAVIVVPDNALDQIYAGTSAQFPVYYRQLNPLQANYIEYNTYIYATEFDKILLREALSSARPQNNQLKEYNDQMDSSLGRLDTNLKGNQTLAARLELERLKVMTKLAQQGVSSLILPGASNSPNPQSSLIGQQVLQSTTGKLNPHFDKINSNLTTIENALLSGSNVSGQTAQVTQMRQANDALRSDSNRLVNVPAAVLVEPILAKAQNLVSTEVNFTNFYAPAVVILLLQHIGVTLAALSIVRDRQIGALEIFRVSPINPTEILIGKFLSFTILLMIVATLLLAALNLLLGVPIVGDLLLVGAVLLASTYASIGLGFLAAGLSRTETQAVQWSMLLILASIFFTGFIVPLTQFNEVVGYVSYALPMTFGTYNLQQVMLDNRTPNLFYLLMPIALGTLYFLIGRFLYKRQFSIG